jgi:hypothetical protein
MPFTLIKGTYRVVRYSPDGDSIRFEADDSALLMGLADFRPKINARNHVQLRIEAVDALETHYSPPSGGGIYHQPLALATAARDALLDFVQIRNIEWDSAGKTVVSADEGARGYILSRSVEKYGRPIAFVFIGEPAQNDGAQVILDIPRLRESYNFSALSRGLVYATYYRGLFNDLREACTDAVRQARQARAGVYAIDATNSGIEASTLRVLTEDAAVMPKLFRRLVEYMVNYGTAVGFKDKLAQAQEPVLDLTMQNFTHFDTFIDQAEGSETIRLIRVPEELVFDEMKARPETMLFSGLMGDERPLRFEGLTGRRL